MNICPPFVRVTGDLGGLLDAAEGLTSRDQRLCFYSQYRAVARRGSETAADTVRLTGLLIRWLEDLVRELPPPPPDLLGAAPSSNRDLPAGPCDDLVIFAVFLKMVAWEAYLLQGSTPLLRSLPGPAQAAWTRLVTTHLPRLPLPARLNLCCTVPCVMPPGASPTFFRQMIIPELLSLMESGDMYLDCGRGARQWVGGEVINLTCELSDYMGPLFAEPFSHVPRRLLLLLYTDLLLTYDSQERAFDQERVLGVSDVCDGAANGPRRKWFFISFN
jgi:hypothetical protein